MLLKKTIRDTEIDKINIFMEDNKWKDLANNVEKLHNGTEKDGIGKFLFEDLNWSTTDCQLAGHLGVILTEAEAWQYNKKQRGIKFKKINFNWRDKVKDYYQLQLLNDIE